MLKGFKTKELVILAIMGAVIFLIGITLGAVIVSATGVPMAGGLITGFVMAFFFAITTITIKKFGSGLILALLVTLLSAPTANMGPPGAYKIIVGLFIGLVIDLILLAGRNSKISYYISIPIAYAFSLPINLIFMKYLGLQGFEKLFNFLIPGMIIYFINALLGVWLAFKVYNKIKNKKIIKQISC